MKSMMFESLLGSFCMDLASSVWVDFLPVVQLPPSA